MDRSGDHALAAGAFRAGIADRSQPLMHDGAAAVARLRDRLHAVAELAQFIECPSCFFRVRFLCHKKPPNVFDAGVIAGHSKEVISKIHANFWEKDGSDRKRRVIPSELSS